VVHRLVGRRQAIASALGKPTIARKTYHTLTETICGEVLNDLGFTNEDRQENAQTGEVASLMMDAGSSSSRIHLSVSTRQGYARQLIGSENFIEIHISTPLNVCEKSATSRALPEGARRSPVEHDRH
jgi:bifunctional enzyme CysN/CysC